MVPFANNQGVNIYYEVDGHGPPLLLAHGATGNTSSWRGFGYVDKLKDDYMVIVYDARGHGQSDKPHETTAYDYRYMTADALAVMDALDLVKTHFWGYSMGGFIGFALGIHHAQRIRSLILGGTSPYSDTTDSSLQDRPLVKVFNAGIAEGPDAAVELMRELFGTITPQYEARLRTLDYQAMLNCYEGMYYWPDFRDELATMTMPCLLYMAEGDDDAEFTGSHAIVKQMPNATFVGLAGYNHVTAFADSESIIPSVRGFLANV